MNKMYILLGVLIVLAFFAGFFVNRFSSGISGSVIYETGNYTWTKAVCNSENWCMDVVISCADGNVVGIEPVDSLVKHGENWTDIRGNSSDIYC